MPFRYSMKRLLFGMVYAVFAAAAFSQQSWVYADLLCAASLLAFCYAVLNVCYSRGPSRAAATGFVVAWVSLVLCLHFSPDSVPMLRFLDASGLRQNKTTLPAASAFFPQAPQTTATLQLYAGPAPASAVQFAPAAPPAAAPPPLDPESTRKLRAANAVATVLFGRVGSCLGWLAFRRREAV
jgi:hypothetical protein